MTTPETQMLLPCPFCGTDPRIGLKGAMIACQNEDCLVQVETFGGDERISRESWNTRAALRAPEASALQPGDTLMGERMYRLAKLHCGDDGPRFLRKIWEAGFRLTDDRPAAPEASKPDVIHHINGPYASPISGHGEYTPITVRASSAPEAGEAKPVAWNCIFPTYGHITLRKEEAEQAALDGADVRAMVYAAPVSADAGLGMSREDGK